MATLSKLCVAGFVGTLVWAGAAEAQTRVTGAGSTFVAPMMAKWTQAYNGSHPDTKADYAGGGSGAGIKGISDRTVMFGASDAPLTSDQETTANSKGPHILHLPCVAGPEVMIYNLPGVTGLKLDGPTVAGIFLKQITSWDDAKIKALNPGLNLPATPISVVHRSDGSGTTFIFTDYLSKVSPEWKSKVGSATAVEWPTGAAGKGNDGVAATVSKSAGAIGYVEGAFATKQKLAYADQINAAGKPVTASIDGVQAAIDKLAANFPPDMKVSITDAPGDDAYPICGFTYLLIYDDLSYMKDKAAAGQMLNFVMWCETDGQAMAKDLGYAKLPKQAQDEVIAKLKTVKFDGEALLK